VGDASSHSETEGNNAKSQRLLGNYFASLKQSGTTKNVVEEKDMITTKLSIVFKRIKFVDSDSELSSTGNIALFWYKELRVPENDREVWWEQMKKHVARNWMREDRIVELLLKKQLYVSGTFCGIFFISNHSHYSIFKTVLVEEERLPPLDQLLLKRDNVEDFFFFFECYLSKVVGVGAWRELCTKQKNSDFATVSDEAFVYLLVENYWDGWSTRRSDEPFMESDLIHGSKKKKRKIAWGKYTAAALGARQYGG